MSGRRIIPATGAGALALAAVALAACGSSNKALIPSTNAADLQNDFAMVQQFVTAGDCAKTAGWIHQAQLHLAALPSGVDPTLRARLTLGIADLSASALQECAQNALSTTSTTSTTSSSVSVTSIVTSTSSAAPVTTSSSPIVTSSSSAPPLTTSAVNGGTPPITVTSATANGNGQGNGNGGNGGNGQGNGQGNGAGGAAAP